MPRVNVFLFIEPERHYLRYGSVVMRAVVEANAKPEYEIHELRGDEANPDKINSIIAERNPAFIYGVGHGAECAYTVECTELYMSVRSGAHASCVRDQNLDIMRGRVLHLNSCLTGAELGPALYEHGALAYIGSYEPFWFYIGDDPGSTRATQSVFLAEYQVEVSLMAGLSVEQAWNDSQDRYDEEIAYWTTGAGRDHPNAASIIRALRVDKSVSIMIGVGGVKVGTPLIPIEYALAGLTLGMSPLLMVGAVISSEEWRKIGEGFK